MKDAYTKMPEQVLSDLHSDGSSGLTKEQAEQSRKKYGSNTFIRESYESLLKKIWDASTEPMLLMLIFAAAVSYTHLKDACGCKIRFCRSAITSSPSFKSHSLYRSISACTSSLLL